jgi:hypothetical protein
VVRTGDNRALLRSRHVSAAANLATVHVDRANVWHLLAKLELVHQTPQNVLLVVEVKAKFLKLKERLHVLCDEFVGSLDEGDFWDQVLEVGMGGDHIVEDCWGAYRLNDGLEDGKGRKRFLLEAILAEVVFVNEVRMGDEVDLVSPCNDGVV